MSKMDEYKQVAHHPPAHQPVTTAFCIVPPHLHEYGHWFVPYDGPLDRPQYRLGLHHRVGPYEFPMQAYLAACRYAYGPIPRDFAVPVPAVTGLEGLFVAPQHGGNVDE